MAQVQIAKSELRYGVAASFHAPKASTPAEGRSLPDLTAYGETHLVSEAR